ncbi:MAG: PorP/SprF family type IX secretion system membrane protein [Bacteroidetes bacterium]|jgi:type IX secretion system PorP/SprF family membrane protein|nr:PorP/SprF family type IX secretion system membrane protein [Bacteroidota bacterium]MDF1865778.1 PorP/SprF family type IX secretion system membrane protein [Saprospiraceae bacterium]
MKLIKTLFFALCLLTIGKLQAQDIHWTSYNMSPLTMNPALTGSYEGTFRIGGIYRDQYRSVVSNAYSTPSAFVDAPILMIGKRNWIGVGAVLFQDVAGTAKLTTSSFQLSGAFHLAMDKKSQNVLTLGAQWGQVTRKIGDFQNLTFEDGILTGAPSQEIQRFNSGGGGGGGAGQNEPQTDYTDLSVGLLFKSKMSKTSSMELGVSARHLINPEYNFISTNNNSRNPDRRLGNRIIAHTRFDFELTDKWSIAPTAYFTNLSPASQFQIQGWAGYKLTPEEGEPIKLNFGLGYRAADAGQVLLGVDYKDFRATAAYDVTLSSLNAVNNYQGGFEIAVWYIAKIFKKPEIKPAILCPHL